MKSKNELYILLLIIVCNCFLLCVDITNAELDTLVRVHCVNKRQTQSLTQIAKKYQELNGKSFIYTYFNEKIELWNKPENGKPTLMAMNSKNIGKAFLVSLKKEKIKYEIVSNNLTNLIEDQKKESYTGFRAGSDNFLQHYHRYRDINHILYSWAKKYPNIFHMKVIGKSVEHRNIYGIQIGDGAAGKSNVLIECGIHAREWISTAACLYIINQLLTKTRNLHGHSFYVVPLMNPDGYEYTWTSNRLWRKNRRKGSRCVGVDLNRNFASNFGGAGASKDPCSETYCGPSAFSEPESKAFRDFALSVENVVASFHLHSYGQMLIFPFGYTKRKSSHYGTMNSLSSRAAASIRRGRGHKYKHGQSSRLLYVSSGCSDDWAYSALKPQVSYTIEGRDSGSYGFLLPQKQILAASAEFWIAITSILNNLKR